jgi:transcription initiation factor TFIIIB Brf1 subunit/transcription initiation factor TFIIB
MEKVSLEELHAAAQLVWADSKTAKEIAIQAYIILNQVKERKPTFYSGRRATALVGGLFYLLGFRVNSVKKQYEIAAKLDITDVTIRASYRKWLIAFSDLFDDVIDKLAQDNSLKYFVLIDLKKAAKTS